MATSDITGFIFNRPPLFGLRGDPLLWKWMKVRFESQDSWTEATFEQMLLDTFVLLTDHLPERGKNFMIHQIDTGGMSGGMICSDYWIDTGFPLLISRFREVVYR